MQMHYGQPRPTPFDDINEFYKKVPEFFAKIQAIRETIEASPGSGLLDATAFADNVNSAIAKGGRGRLLDGAREAAERLVEIALEKLREETPLSR